MTCLNTYQYLICKEKTKYEYHVLSKQQYLIEIKKYNICISK